MLSRTILPLSLLLVAACAQVPGAGENAIDRGSTPPAVVQPHSTQQIESSPNAGTQPQRAVTPAAPRPARAGASVTPETAEISTEQPRVLVAIEPAPPRTVWDRIRNGFAMAPMDNDLVREWENWYANRPDYVERMIDRSSHFLFHIVEQVEKRGMPMEIALLPMIESAYNPVAYSRAHASGIWQFIPSTGKDFGLRQNWWYDGRRDVIAATDAALDYLAEAPRHVRRLAARARLLQLGRRRGRPRDGAQPRARACRPTTRA